RRRGVTILQGWGMTETSPSGSRVSSRVPVRSTEDLGHLTTQGVAVPGVEVRLWGPDGREVAWDGVSTGELEVRGPWVASGYLGLLEDEQAESFHEGWLRPGDVAAIDPDGSIRLVDRLKDLVKSGGEWISSIELEAHIMSHPAIREAAVVA